MRPLVDAYIPSPDVQTFGRCLHVVGVIGPVAVGKNTLMTASGMTIASPETSREPRPGETSYQRYYDFTNPTDRNDARTNIQEGRYLQIAAHPASGEFYMSLPEHYDINTRNLMDVTAAEYKRMRKTGLIGNLAAVYVVPISYDAWQGQWRKRDGDVDTPTTRSRTREAYDSMLDCFSCPEIPFLVNEQVDKSAQRLRELAEGGTMNKEEWVHGRMIARQLLLDIAQSGLHRPDSAAD